MVIEPDFDRMPRLSIFATGYGKIAVETLFPNRAKDILWEFCSNEV